MDRPSSAEARRLLAFAEEDLAYGRDGVERFPRSAAWSFEQAAEKALKAVLIHNGIEPPRSHDLVYLLTLLGDRYTVTPDLRDAALALTTIGPATRYPGEGPEISLEAAQAAEAQAVLIVEWARSLVH